MKEGVFDLMRDPKRLGPNILSGLIGLCCTVPRNGIMYEIGSYAGESAEVFARFFAEVHCVDPWANLRYMGVTNAAIVEREFDRRTGKLPNVRKHKTTSLLAARDIMPGVLDFVYIDAAHDYENVLRDLTAWWPKVRVGGAIGGHDYLPPSFEWTQVSRAVDEFFVGKTPTLFSDTSWMVRKERQG